jgi:putative DNA primase/helicase
MACQTRQAFPFYEESLVTMKKLKINMPGGKTQEFDVPEPAPIPIPLTVTKESVKVYGLQSVADIEKEHKSWLWPGYLPTNKLVHWGGASTEGKSPVALDVIARLTSGSAWPDGSRNEVGPRSAILLAGEDDWSDTIKPRLELAGADVKKVLKFISSVKTGDTKQEIAAAIDRDIGGLTEMAKSVSDLSLIVIDPITNYLGSAKMNDEAMVRGGITMPLSTLAQACNYCVITIGHLNKRGDEASFLQRLMGAAAFAGVARLVYGFGNDPEDEDKYKHVMFEARDKAAPSLKYKTEAVQVAWDGKESPVIRVKWGGVSTADLDQVINAPKQGEKTHEAKASELIRGLLLSGAKTKASIDDALKEAGYAPDKLNFSRMKKRIGADCRKMKGAKASGSEWFLPTAEQQGLSI